MKIGIHNSDVLFSKRWQVYCEANNISYKVVDCYSTDIIEQLRECDALMWHFHQGNPKDILIAKQLIYAVEASGKKVFPDFHTMWHFNDKVGQKYLLEAIGAPIAPTWVFYDKRDALNWVQKAKYPFVFKLRNGAGSSNVRLVESKDQAVKIVNKAFKRGFNQYLAWENLKERYRKYRLKKTTLYDVLKGILRLIHKPNYSRASGRERGYVYFQKFIPNNDYDIRVIVIGKRAFAIKRMARTNDFRASGSGYILYKKEHFDDTTVKISFDLAIRMNTQCIAFDFVYENGFPVVVEISYGFDPEGYEPCPGYWDSDLKWHEGNFNPYGWMVDLIIEQ